MSCPRCGRPFSPASYFVATGVVCCYGCRQGFRLAEVGPALAHARPRPARSLLCALRRLIAGR